jgi:hypothetical protein
MDNHEKKILTHLNLLNNLNGESSDNIFIENSGNFLAGKNNNDSFISIIGRPFYNLENVAFAAKPDDNKDILDYNYESFNWPDIYGNENYLQLSDNIEIIKTQANFYIDNYHPYKKENKDYQNLIPKNISATLMMKGSEIHGVHFQESHDRNCIPGNCYYLDLKSPNSKLIKVNRVYFHFTENEFDPYYFHYNISEDNFELVNEGRLGEIYIPKIKLYLPLLYKNNNVGIGAPINRKKLVDDLNDISKSHPPGQVSISTRYNPYYEIIYDFKKPNDCYYFSTDIKKIIHQGSGSGIIYAISEQDNAKPYPPYGHLYPHLSIQDDDTCHYTYKDSSGMTKHIYDKSNLPEWVKKFITQYSATYGNSDINCSDSKYAVVISGGGNPDIAYRNYYDNVLTYTERLVELGYYVYIFYGGHGIGTGSNPNQPLSPTYHELEQELITRGFSSRVILQPAKKDIIRSQIKFSCSKLKQFVEKDSNYKGGFAIFTSNHGGASGPNFENPVLSLWDPEPGYTPDEMYLDLQECANKQINTIGVFDQCFSGSFINRISQDYCGDNKSNKECKKKYFCKWNTTTNNCDNSESNISLFSSGNFFSAAGPTQASYGRHYTQNLENKYNGWYNQKTGPKSCNNKTQQCKPFQQLHCVASGYSQPVNADYKDGTKDDDFCERKWSGARDDIWVNPHSKEKMYGLLKSLAHHTGTGGNDRSKSLKFNTNCVDSHGTCGFSEDNCELNPSGDLTCANSGKPCKLNNYGNTCEMIGTCKKIKKYIRCLKDSDCPVKAFI